MSIFLIHALSEFGNFSDLVKMQQHEVHGERFQHPFFGYCFSSSGLNLKRSFKTNLINSSVLFS